MGRIAEHDLTEAARREVATLLGDEPSTVHTRRTRGHVTDSALANISNWADQIRRERQETAPWHYVNIAPDAEGYDGRRDCPGGSCVVEQVKHFAAVLSDSTLSHDERRDALKFLVHFVGDLHQPLHCGYAADRGGNSIKLTCIGRQANLHEVWDTLMIERQKLTAEKYAQELLDNIDETDRTFWLRSGPDDWANESFVLAGRYAYCSTRGRPLRSGDHFSRADLIANTFIVDRQLCRAGVRLAAMINAAVAKSATQPAVSERATSQPATQPNG